MQASDAQAAAVGPCVTPLSAAPMRSSSTVLGRSASAAAEGGQAGLQLPGEALDLVALAVCAWACARLGCWPANGRRPIGSGLCVWDVACGMQTALAVQQSRRERFARVGVQHTPTRVDLMGGGLPQVQVQIPRGLITYCAIQ